jgi:ferric-dicitrate binding protein FerR (iron transport regulator)
MIVLAAISALAYKYMLSHTDTVYVSTSYGERKEVVLPDGSVVILNSLSKLSYPEEMDGDTREVHLQGEGYFDVAKDAKRTFTVKVENLNIKALGTKFNIEAYENEESITTTLFEGSVSVNLDNGYTNKLEPGQQAVFRKNENKASITESAGIDEKINRQKGIFTFDNIPLSEILKTLNREYNKDFKLNNQALEKLRITVRIDANEPVETILTALGESADFNFHTDGNAYIIISK